MKGTVQFKNVGYSFHSTRVLLLISISIRIRNKSFTAKQETDYGVYSECTLFLQQIEVPTWSRVLESKKSCDSSSLFTAAT
jgi:hypothetical protein